MQASVTSLWTTSGPGRGAERAAVDYGGLGTSMQKLPMAVGGGVSWQEIIAPRVERHPEGLVLQSPTPRSPTSQC